MTKREKIFVWVLAVVLIGSTTVPYLIGHAITPANHTFTGLHNFTTGDTATYYSFIEQAREGNLLFKNLYTSEQHDSVLLSPLWLVLGGIGNIIPLSAPILFHVARILLIPVFLFVAYRLITSIIDSMPVRYLALVLIGFGSGVGFLFGNAFDGNGVNMPVDMWVPEAVTFSTLYHSPLLIASVTLLMATMFYFYTGLIRKQMLRVLAAGALAALLLLLHPFYVPTIYAVTGVCALILVLQKRHTFFSALRMYTLYVVCTFPTLAYFGWLYSTQEVYRQWATGNVLSSPNVLFYLIGFGLFIPFAILGVVRTYKQKEFLFPLVWLLVTAALLYVPFDFQRRLVEGIHIPLGIFSAVALWHLWGAFRKRASVMAPIFVVLIALFFFMTPLTLLVQDVLLYQEKQTYPFYVPETDARAMEWLREYAAQDAVVLSDVFWTGNFIPWLSVRTAYVGHGPQTIALREKQALVRTFFSELTSHDWRRNFLSTQKITHVLYTQAEQNLGGFQPDQAPYLIRSYYSGTTSVYEVSDEIVTSASASGTVEN